MQGTMSESEFSHHQEISAFLLVKSRSKMPFNARENINIGLHCQNGVRVGMKSSDDV